MNSYQSTNEAVNESIVEAKNKGFIPVLMITDSTGKLVEKIVNLDSLQVTETGVEISACGQTKLFESFYQGELVLE